MIDCLNRFDKSASHIYNKCKDLRYLGRFLNGSNMSFVNADNQTTKKLGKKRNSDYNKSNNFDKALSITQYKENPNNNNY